MRQGVTGTKLKPGSEAAPIKAAEDVFSVPSFSDAIADAWPGGAGIAADTGLGAELWVAEVTGRDADAGLNVPAAPPQPAKENTMRDKQIRERIPGTQNDRWRRIGYLPQSKVKCFGGV
jgi:hypothetical protein